MNKKVVIVTGASSGIGKEIAKQLLLRQDCRVYALARRTEQMDDLRRLGASVHYLDITDRQSILFCVREIYRREGQFDMLFNVAGSALYGSLEDVPVQKARELFEVNLFGLAELTRAVLPAMRKKRSGIIINISSVAGRVPTLLGSWYGASKFALEGLSDCLRIELKRFGIKVILVEPGPILTPWARIASIDALKYSGHTEYATLAKASYHFFSDSKLSTKPYGTARTIVNAAFCPNPKARYVTPCFYSAALNLRYIFGDNFVDKVAMKIFRL